MIQNNQFPVLIVKTQSKIFSQDNKNQALRICGKSYSFVVPSKKNKTYGILSTKHLDFTTAHHHP